MPILFFKERATDAYSIYLAENMRHLHIIITIAVCLFFIETIPLTDRFLVWLIIIQKILEFVNPLFAFLFRFTFFYSTSAPSAIDS